MTNKALVTKTKQELTVTPEKLIQDARDLARWTLNLQGQESISKREAAEVDFYAMQNLIKRGSLTESAIAKLALELYKKKIWVALSMSTWEEFWSGLGEEGPSDGLAQIEMSSRLKYILSAMVPKFLEPLSILGGTEGPLKDITVDQFLDGQWSAAIELVSLVRTLDLSDPRDLATWTEWTIKAASESPKELRKLMQDAGQKGTRGRDIEPIPALTSLETHYCDPTTGEKVDGEVMIVTLYLRTRQEQALYSNRMGAFVHEVRNATPKGKRK